jgi:hypothetical protein
MITDKIDMMKLQSIQYEMLAIQSEFLNSLQTHFKVVDANARRLIDTRWE